MYELFRQFTSCQFQNTGLGFEPTCKGTALCVKPTDFQASVAPHLNTRDSFIAKVLQGTKAFLHDSCNDARTELLDNLYGSVS